MAGKWQTTLPWGILMLALIIGPRLCNGLNCYQCFSANTWRDCKVLTSRNCRSPESMCGKVYTKQSNLESYYRDCYTREFCESKSACTSQMSKCSVNCCSEENCNSSTSSRSQVALILVTTLPALFILLLTN